jgi:hypothetical protein
MGRVIEQTEPFVAKKSSSIYRLVEEEEGKHVIEKVMTAISVEEEIPDGSDPAAVFKEFVTKKQERSGREKLAISSEEAFTLHHVQGLPWTEIAAKAGQKGSSLSDRMSGYTKKLALAYMKGADIHKTAEELNISANQLHDILARKLEREREQLLENYERGKVMRSHDGDVKKVVEITNFLSDWESFEYQVVEPLLGDDPELNDGKKILYSEDFYTVELKSGRQYRLSIYMAEAAWEHHWRPSYLEHQMGMEVSSDPIVMIYDMFGNKSSYTEDALEGASG